MPGEPPLLLSRMPPSRKQNWAALAFAAALFFAFLVSLYFKEFPLPAFNAFIPIVDTTLSIGDLITAALLFAQFSVARSPALLVLANGYVFTGFIIIPHLLTFPGAFASDGLLGAGLNTTVWLYYFWHGGLPIAVIAYALLQTSKHQSLSNIGTSFVPIAITVALTTALVFSLTLPSISARNISRQ